MDALWKRWSLGAVGCVANMESVSSGSVCVTLANVSIVLLQQHDNRRHLCWWCLGCMGALFNRRPKSIKWSIRAPYPCCSRGLILWPVHTGHLSCRRTGGLEARLANVTRFLLGKRRNKFGFSPQTPIQFVIIGKKGRVVTENRSC